MIERWRCCHTADLCHRGSWFHFCILEMPRHLKDMKRKSSIDCSNWWRIWNLHEFPIALETLPSEVWIRLRSVRLELEGNKKGPERDKNGKLIVPSTTSPSHHLFFRWDEPGAGRMANAVAKWWYKMICYKMLQDDFHWQVNNFDWQFNIVQYSL